MRATEQMGRKCEQTCSARTAAHLHGLEIPCFQFLGLTPQALCLRLLRRLKADFSCKAGSTRFARKVPCSALLCATSVFSVPLWWFTRNETTEQQRTQRVHRESNFRARPVQR